MKRLRDGREQPRFLTDSPPFNTGGLLKAGFFSLLLHIGLIVILGLSAKPVITRMVPSVYRVTIRPFSPPGYGIPQGRSGYLIGSLGGLSSSTPIKKLKTIENTKGSEVIEKIKPQQKKAEKKEGKSEKEERPEKEKVSFKSLQESIEDIHKKVALDEIQKRVARREREEKLPAEGKSSERVSTQEPIISSSRRSSVLGFKTGTEMKSGAVLGGGLIGESQWGSSILESKLNDYYNMIWAKIKKEWTLPENLPKGKTDLEAIIVVIIEKEGKIQKTWFEKRSGNALYDQMAMRAIKKAEPFPPIPKEFSNETFEIGIRFHPD